MARTIDRKQVYFTWPDGVLGYDCRGCGDCCKGLGIGLDESGGQVEQLVGLYPALTPFLRKRGAAWTAFNPRGRCFFLDDQGLCRVEMDHGRAQKPASCRLFPFNRVFRLGAYTIVDYNSVICPLQVFPDRDADAAAHDDSSPPTNPAVSHDAILEEMASIADPAVIGTTLLSEPSGPESGVRGKRFVDRERAIAEVCFDQAARETPALDAVWRAQSKEGSFDQARRRLSRAMELVTGRALSLPSPATIRTALWLTPSMRFNELFGPRNYKPQPERERALPVMWLAWLHWLAETEALASRPPVRSEGSDAPTARAARSLDLRQATSIWGEGAPLGYLLAHWNQAPTMTDRPPAMLEVGEAEEFVRHLVDACMENRKERAPISKILQRLLNGRPVHQRVVMARAVEALYMLIQWRKPRKS